MSAHDTPQAVAAAILVVPARRGPRAHAVRVAERSARAARPADRRGGPGRARERARGAARLQEGAFDVHRYADEAAAREAIEDREVYGAFVAGPGGTEAADGVRGQPRRGPAARATPHPRGGAASEVQDVVAGTPHATALASSVLPLVIAGILTGVVASLLAAGWLARAGLVVAGSVLCRPRRPRRSSRAGSTWSGATGGETPRSSASPCCRWRAAWPASMPCSVRRAWSLRRADDDLHRQPVLGRGLGAGAAAAAGRALGQLMPPGAGGNLLRSTGYFDGAAAGEHVAVLVAWALVGLMALGVAAARSRRPVSAGSRGRAWTRVAVSAILAGDVRRERRGGPAPAGRVQRR